MTDLHTIGILSPGHMGGAVAQVLARGGLHPIAALEGRSERTRRLAAEAGVADVGTLEALVREADAILSILVPARAQAAAEAVAAAMRATGARPLYADCNAVSLETALAIGDTLAAAGAPYVDASIIGPPPQRPGTTRFYASGTHAATFAQLGAHGLDVRVLEGPLGRATCIKTAYAGLNKGLGALAMTLMLYAEQSGTGAALAEELRLSMPPVYERLQRMLPILPPRAHRFVGEMEEHGRALAAAGLPPGMMEGAAALYDWMAGTTPGRETPEGRAERSLDELIAALAAELPPR